MLTCLYLDTRSKKKRPDIKVGHGGTLDPCATGVLVLGIGSATKVLTAYLQVRDTFTNHYAFLALIRSHEQALCCDSSIRV
jgi:tRNA pseudouridine55 synthase